MISKFVLILYFGVATNTNPIAVNFETRELCEKERKHIEQYYYSVGLSNVKGICVQTKE